MILKINSCIWTNIVYFYNETRISINYFPSFIFILFFKRFIYLYLDRGEGRKKEERNINVWLPLTRPILGTRPSTQACSLTENWTSDTLVRRPVLSPLSHTSQGSSFIFNNIKSEDIYLCTGIPQTYCGFGARLPQLSDYCNKESCNLFAGRGSCFQFVKKCNTCEVH